MVYGYSARKSSPGIVTLVPCHLMVAISHAKQGMAVDLIHWYPILEEVFTDLAWITRSQDSFPME